MIRVYSKREINKIRIANALVGEALDFMGELIEPGITTAELDYQLETFIRERGARPAFKGIEGDAPDPFPASGCFSIDEVVVHGIPSGRKLREGQIIGIDVGTEIGGYYGDAARTFPVGEVSFDKLRLIKTTEDSFWKGLEYAFPGNRLGDISHHIQKMAEGRGFSVVRALVGHGIGQNLHESPQIPNYGNPKIGPLLQEGMIFAVEPMINMGTFDVAVLEDGWTVVTADRKPSAHYENTFVITANGPEILTVTKDLQN
jgi:methionyl aminopeptidase